VERKDAIAPPLSKQGLLISIAECASIMSTAIGIEMGIAPPYDPGVLIDKGRGATVSDQGQVEILFFCLRALGHAALPRANSASQPRTACGAGNAPIAPGRERPTE